MTVWLCDCSMVLFPQVEQKKITFRTHSHFTIVCDYLGNFWPRQMTISILCLLCERCSCTLVFSKNKSVQHAGYTCSLCISISQMMTWVVNANNAQKLPPAVEGRRTAPVALMCKACGPHFERTKIRDFGRLCHTVVSQMHSGGHDTHGCFVHTLKR